MRATSVLGNAKSNCHRKTHRVEPDGPDGECTHLTRGGLPGESEAGVSKGRSSEEARVTAGGAKGRREGETRIARSPRGIGREGFRNEAGVTITVATRRGASGLDGWIAVWNVSAGAESGNGRRKGKTMNASETPMVTMEEVVSAENLNEAWARVKANGGAAGVDGRTVAQTGELICGQQEELLELLLGGKYSPKAVKAVDIPKASGGGRRLGIPTVLDRWLQQAVHQKLGPLWESEFSEHSYGFRPNRSAHDAVRAAQDYV